MKKLQYILIYFLILGCSEKRNTQVLKVSQIDKLLIKKEFKTSNNLKMPYRFFKSTINENKKPLIVFLHGRGDRGTDNDAKIYHEFGWITKETSLLNDSMQKEYPCHILIPQCSDVTVNEEWAKWKGNTPETPFEGLGKDGSYYLNDTPSLSGKAALELIEDIIKTENVDTNKVYLIGLSMGGFGTWEFTARKPNIFAAAIPMAGYSDSNQIENIKHIPYWIFHGNTDKWNPVEGSRKMFKLLSEQNADVKYTEYENTGHGDAFKKAFNEPKLLPWLFSKSKHNND